MNKLNSYSCERLSQEETISKQEARIFSFLNLYYLDYLSYISNASLEDTASHNNLSKVNENGNKKKQWKKNGLWFMT